MIDYPEALVGKVADVIVEFAPDNPPGVQQMWSYGIAERVLDALGLREEISSLYVNLHGRTAVRDRARHRYVTEWESADD